MVKDHSESRCRHMGYYFRLTARVLLYAPSQDITFHGLCSPVVEHWLEREIAQWVHPMKDRSDEPSHHERRLLQRSYISLKKEGMKEMFYEKMHSPYFKLRLYDVGPMLKVLSDSEKGNPLLQLHEICFRLAVRNVSYEPSHRQDKP